MILGAAGANAATGPGVSEYAVKAAFVYDFAKFVNWPQHAFKNDSSPITICVLGVNPFGDALSQLVSGKSVDGRAFTVEYPQDASAAGNCRIVFVSSSERDRLPQILVRLGRAGALTVGDTDGFAKRGIMINLFLDGDRVRFKINPGAAARAGIGISSKLLSLATIVKE